MHSARLNKLREQLAKDSCDVAVLTDLSNIFYFCGFTGSAAVLIVAEDTAELVVDPRYTLQANQECKAVTVREYSGKPQMEAVGNALGDIKAKNTAFEADNMTVSAHQELRKNTPAAITLHPKTGLASALRAVKDEHEIVLCKQAAQITDAAMAHVKELLVPGVSEKEIEQELIVALRKNGADKEGFDPIVAFGVNAVCPHASPTETKLTNNSFVKLDFGARYKNYNADITRTVAVGDPGKFFYEVYDIVLSAQLAAIESIKPGRTGKEIDSVAREYIKSAGYGANFGHGLGHALGIEVHDGPGFSQLSNIVLEPGMVMTVEPGIYIEGWGGIRIEDDIVVTEDGCEVITHFPK